MLELEQAWQLYDSRFNFKGFLDDLPAVKHRDMLPRSGPDLETIERIAIMADMPFDLAQFRLEIAIHNAENLVWNAADKNSDGGVGKTVGGGHRSPRDPVEPVDSKGSSEPGVDWDSDVHEEDEFERALKEGAAALMSAEEEAEQRGEMPTMGKNDLFMDSLLEAAMLQKSKEEDMAAGSHAEEEEDIFHAAESSMKQLDSSVPGSSGKSD